MKIPLRDGDTVEWFWIADFRNDGDVFSGRINNTPRLVTNFRNGETVRFARKDIVDWMYVVDGKMKGNFTACAIAAKQPEAEREKFLRTFNMTCSA